MKFKNYIIFFINILLIGGCNKQSEPIKYNESITTEEIYGYSRDMLINNDTLFVVNEDEGLLIYKIKLDLLTNSLILDSLYSDLIYYQDNGWKK